MNKILSKLMCSLGLMSDERSINIDELENINGLLYEINKKTPYTGKVNIYYESGKVKSRKNYKNGLDNGGFITYSDDGDIRAKGNFKDGERDGESIAYYESGEIRIKMNYKDGIKNGEFTTYYENGKIKYKENYKNGKLIF